MRLTGDTLGDILEKIMDRTNTQFLEIQFREILKEIINDIDFDNLIFNINFDPEEVQEPKTNFDEIMFYRVIPKIIDKDLLLDEMCEILVDGKNEIPLWIKLNQLTENKFQVLISKRFRKKKIIEEWHKDNIYKPIIIKTSPNRL